MSSIQEEDQIQSALAAILPQISRQIALKYQQDTQQKRLLSYKNQQQKLEQQAYQQYQQLSRMIQAEHEKAIETQKIEFQKQMLNFEQIQSSRQKVSNFKYQQFKLKMNISNIEQIIFKSEQMSYLKQQITNQIEQQYIIQYEQDLNTFSKQISYKSSIRLKKELQTGKRQIDQKIQQISSDLSKQVVSDNIQLATLRSKSNIQIKKLSTSKQQFIKKYEIQSIQKQQLYQQLLLRYKQIQKQAIQSAGVHLKNSFVDPYSKNQSNCNMLFDLISEQSPQKSNSQYQQQSSVSHISQTQFQSAQLPYSRILDIDLRKYNSIDTQSQNKSINELSNYIPQKQQQIKQSKFGAMYKKQLQKMNKKNKISAVAKDVILKAIIKKGDDTKFKFVNLR